MAELDLIRVRRLYTTDQEIPRNPYEFRTQLERDYDRIIYSSAFRKLAGITQVVNPSEGQPFHNRLTHSIKVAALGRRISQKLQREYNKRLDILDSLGGLDPSVVEAAALAHDLGNPPFGHAAEAELDRLVKDKRVTDGFEGNAQSFRIVNKLSFGYSVGNQVIPGLNLTRATLCAILKYPWMSGSNPHKRNKCGAYHTETTEFEWARELFPNRKNVKTLEATIMDLADDITYAVHDLEDFYRANLIPFGSISSEIDEEEFCEKVANSKETWFPKNGEKIDAKSHYDRFLKIEKGTNIRSPFHGTAQERMLIHEFSSTMIDRFLNNIKVNEDLDRFPSPIILDEDYAVDIIIMKNLTHNFVIKRTGLQRQQYGETKIIEFLFNTLYDATFSPEWIKIFPIIGQQRLKTVLSNKEGVEREEERVRIVTDVICNMTDSEAIKLYGKLKGFSPGSIFEHFS